MNYPYYPMGRPMPGMEQAQLKGRPVSSIDEVRAMTVDFDGSIFYFPDLANKKIYTKQINMDGTCTVNMYELKPIPTQQAVNPSQYVTREEFEAAFTRLQRELAAGQVSSAPQQVQSSAPVSAPVENQAKTAQPQAASTAFKF